MKPAISNYKAVRNTIKLLFFFLTYVKSKSHQRDYAYPSSCTAMDYSLNDPKVHPLLEPPKTHYIGYMP